MHSLATRWKTSIAIYGVVYDSIGESETLEEEINLREDLLNAYKVFLFDMQRVVDYHASQSYEYIEISHNFYIY